MTPVIASAGGWKRITAAGMVTFNTKTKRTGAPVWIFRKGMRKEKMLSILKDIKKRYSRYQFVMLWDSLPSHKAKMVMKYVEENKRWLTAVRFPSYAPELNPQEYVWSGVKRSDLGNYTPPTIQSLHWKMKERGSPLASLGDQIVRFSGQKNQLAILQNAVRADIFKKCCHFCFVF